MSRAWIAGVFVLACRGVSVSAPEVDAPAPVVAARPPSSQVGWEPLIAYREAGLAVPVNPDAAACDAAAEAATRAGVLDVAAYWRGEARRLAPTPAREQAWQAARAEAGYDAPAPFLAPLDPALAGALRAAVEGHAWDEVLALAEPALATAPHHELYLWAGDASWQQGREVAARRMWSRARVLLRAAKVPLRLRRADTYRVSQLAWSAGGLAYFREEKRATFLEVQGERAERPWRRWQVPGRSALAWSRSVLAAARGSTLTLHDPASGAVLAETTAHDVPIGSLAAAADAPVFATEGWGGEIKVWRRTAVGLELVRVIATHHRVAKLALDPSGARLAILRSDAAVEVVSLADGVGRSIAVGQGRPMRVRFVGERVLLVGHDGGRVTRVELADDGASTQAVDLDAESIFPVAGVPPEPTSVASSIRCDFSGDCHWRRRVPAETVAAPDGTRRAIAQDGGVRVVDPAAGEAVIVPPQTSVKIAAISRDGGAVAVAGERGIAVWDARTGAKLLARDGGRFLAFSSDGREAAIVGATPGVEIHRLGGGEPVILRGDSRAHALRWSLDGRRVAVAAGNQLAAWELGAAAPLWTVEFERPVTQLEFTAAGDLVFETLGVLHVHAADGSRAPPRLLGGRRVDSWSVSPDGTALLACITRDVGTQPIDLSTYRAGRRLRGLCNPGFVDADRVFVTESLDARLVDLRGGAPVELDWAMFLSRATQVNGVVFAARLERQDERLMIAARDGRKLATVVPRAGLGWYVVSERGAVDGDPTAPTTMEAEVGHDPNLQRYPAVLAWDAVHVPGLLPRVFAGEDVRPPRID